MYKNKFLAALLCLLLAFTCVLGGCKSSSSHKASSKSISKDISDLKESISQISDVPFSDIPYDQDKDIPVESMIDDGVITIGISMPTSDLQRWNNDGNALAKELNKSGYYVNLQFASNDIDTQISQIETLINENCQVLIITPIEPTSLTSVLEMAVDLGIKVISYDRLIRDTDAVDYYVTFDNYIAGMMQGEYIVDKLNLVNSEGTFNLEIFAGANDDPLASYYYVGAMDVLRPYIDSGMLVVRSGEVDFADVYTARWSTEEATNRMTDIIESYYSDGASIDAVLCSNDSTAYGVSEALLELYDGSWPVITGMDCDIVNVQNIIDGYQDMSIFKDTEILIARTVKMVDSIIEGTNVEVNDTYTFDNGKIIVPSFLCEPIYVDSENYEEILIDSEYYDSSMFG